MYTPIYTKELHGGTQQVYRFNNGYGASVVQHLFSYGNEAGLFELAVIKFQNKRNHRFKITYSTSITDDVVGYLDEQGVDLVLSKIEALE